MQVTEPLRAMVVGSALEDARHLAQRYDRVRQEAESQVTVDTVYIIMNSDPPMLNFCFCDYKNEIR